MLSWSSWKCQHSAGKLGLSCAEEYDVIWYSHGSQDRIVSIATRVQGGWPRSLNHGRDKRFLSYAQCWDQLWDWQNLTSVGTGGCLQGVQQPGNEAAWTPPSSAKVKMEWNCTSNPPIHPYVFMVCTCTTVPYVSNHMNVTFNHLSF
jgi:hypothetical protein